MWNAIGQPGLANASVDFTTALSPLIFGLYSLLALCTGLIALTALHHQRSQKTKTTVEYSSALTSSDDQRAA